MTSLSDDGHLISVPIEQLQVGDYVLSRHEDQPDSPPRLQQIEAVFVREATLLDLRIAGQLIRTTAEHPFFVQNKGWTAAGELGINELVLTHDGQWLPVEGITASERLETVYNVRVAEDHTYFVGGHEWGFGVWVHNATYLELKAATGWSTPLVKRALRLLKDQGPEAFRKYASARLPNGINIEDILTLANRSVDASGRNAPLIGRILSNHEKKALALEIVDVFTKSLEKGVSIVLPDVFLQTSKRTRSSIMQIANKYLPAELRHGNSVDSLMPNIGYRLICAKDGSVYKYGITADFRGMPGQPGFSQNRYTQNDLFHFEAGEQLIFEPLVGPGFRQDLLEWETLTIIEHERLWGRLRGNIRNN